MFFDFVLFRFVFFLTKVHKELRCGLHSLSPLQFPHQYNRSNNNYTSLRAEIAKKNNSYHLLSFTLSHTSVKSVHMFRPIKFSQRPYKAAIINLTDEETEADEAEKLAQVHVVGEQGELRTTPTGPSI